MAGVLGVAVIDRQVHRHVASGFGQVGIVRLRRCGDAFCVTKLPDSLHENAHAVAFGSGSYVTK